MRRNSEMTVESIIQKYQNSAEGQTHTDVSQ